jgi:hypothetical protein
MRIHTVLSFGLISFLSVSPFLIHPLANFLHFLSFKTFYPPFFCANLKNFLGCPMVRYILQPCRDIAWFASPMLYQLSHEVKLVRVGDILERSPVPESSS